MRLVLVRHAHSQSNLSGVLSGQLPGVHLSDEGKKQAAELIHRLGAFPVGQIRTSPMERCLETITPWFESHVKPVSSKTTINLDESLSEVDYGTWSGKKLSSLARKKDWRIVQQSPSQMYFPGGEGLAAVQARAMKSIHEIVKTQQDKNVVIVSHGDVIKSIVASVLGMHLDDFQRIVIDPASISIFEFSSEKPRALLLNDSRAVVTDLLVQPKRSKNLLGGGSGK